MYSFSTSRSWNCRDSSWCAASFFATTITPDVPRSSRCTMPGRSSPPMPLRSLMWWSSALTSVPRGVAGGRMHDHAGRLVDDDDVGVLIEDLERQLLGARRRRARLGQRRRRRDRPRAPRVGSRRRGRGDGARGRPSISRWICDREWSARTDDEKAIEAAVPRRRQERRRECRQRVPRIRKPARACARRGTRVPASLRRLGAAPATTSIDDGQRRQDAAR